MDSLYEDWEQAHASQGGDPGTLEYTHQASRDLPDIHYGYSGFFTWSSEGLFQEGRLEPGDRPLLQRPADPHHELKGTVRAHGLALTNLQFSSASF
jgi:hypothetical protein